MTENDFCQGFFYALLTGSEEHFIFVEVDIKKKKVLKNFMYMKWGDFYD